MIWGLDTATRCTGITAGDGSTTPAVGTWKFDHCGEDYGRLLFEFDQMMTALAGRLGPPTYVVYESPIPPSRHDRLMTLRKLYSMGPYLEVWCMKRGIDCREKGPKSLKKALTGDHLAPKSAMVAVVRGLGIHLPGDKSAEDAADSFAAWYIGLQDHGDRAHLTKWDQAIHSRRGSLV